MLLLAMMELVYRVKSNPKGHVALSENDEESDEGTIFLRHGVDPFLAIGEDNGP